MRRVMRALMYPDPGWSAVAGVLLGGAIVLAGTLAHGPSIGRWLLPAAVTALAVCAGSYFQTRGTRREQDEKARDRYLAWRWHHPVESTIAVSLTQGFVLSAFIALMYERTGIAWAQLAGLVTLMVAVVLLASRSSIPARYTGTDPAVSSGR